MDKPKNPDEIPAQLEQLNRTVGNLFSTESSSSQSLLLFVRRELIRYKIKDQYHEYEIIKEAYIRTIKSIENGFVINNIPAWLKKVSLNIIREYSRKASRSRELTSQLIHIHKTQEGELCEDLEQDFSGCEKIEALLAAFEQLRPDEKEILILRKVKGLSWQEIQQELEAKGKRHQVANLRKKGERALSRLKQIFDTVDQT